MRLICSRHWALTVALALSLGLAGQSPRAIAGAPDPGRDPVKIAFIDTGNTGRSVAAEALADRLVRSRGLRVLVISRAIDVDPFETSPEPAVARLLAARGMDVRRHRAEGLTADDVRHASLILTMTAEHRRRVIERFPGAAPRTFTLAAYAVGKSEDVADAKGLPAAASAEMIRQLDRLLPLALARASDVAP